MSDGSLPRLLTAREVAEATRLPLSTVYELSRRGEIPTVRIGGRTLRFAAPAIRSWIEEGGSSGDVRTDGDRE
ncbi:MAG TPA: helix-turn-helix domain-containing protein [Woeseiaceae bacterium]|jgi:excisionase family DNA binding protein|nr:helix-turn-helix domain-containing protein [Woeseiaceae bacterium]